jgi:hypothetical protein
VNAGTQDTLRLAAIMIDPRCVELFGRMANPAQDRLALQFPELRANAIKQQLLQLLTTDFFNNPAFCPTHHADISNWCDAEYDVSAPCETRSWIWVGEKIRYIKTGMTTLLANFTKSGLFVLLVHNCMILSQATLKMEWMTRLAISFFGQIFAIISPFGNGSIYAGTTDGMCQLGQLLFFRMTFAWMLVQKNQQQNSMLHLQETPNGQDHYKRLFIKRPQLRQKMMPLCPCLKYRSNG